MGKMSDSDAQVWRAAIGWNINYPMHGGYYSDGVHSWRLTRRWARAAVARHYRVLRRREARDAARHDVYLPKRGDS